VGAPAFMVRGQPTRRLPDKDAFFDHRRARIQALDSFKAIPPFRA
jgi:hypothetical protein